MFKPTASIGAPLVALLILNPDLNDHLSGDNAYGIILIYVNRNKSNVFRELSTASSLLRDPGEALTSFNNNAIFKVDYSNTKGSEAVLRSPVIREDNKTPRYIWNNSNVEYVMLGANF